MPTATEFNDTVDALFEALLDSLDDVEAADDVEINQGVLEISCTDGSKIVVNRHAPSQEIWVAARSGGYHFRCDGGDWRDTRSGEALAAAMTRVLHEQTGVRVGFKLPGQSSSNTE